MREQLIKIAEKAGFKSKSFDPNNEWFYNFWLYELQKWLREEHDICIEMEEYVNLNLEAGLIEALNLILESKKTD